MKFSLKTIYNSNILLNHFCSSVLLLFSFRYGFHHISKMVAVKQGQFEIVQCFGVSFSLILNLPSLCLFPICLICPKLQLGICTWFGHYARSLRDNASYMYRATYSGALVIVYLETDYRITPTHVGFIFFLNNNNI